MRKTEAHIAPRFAGRQRRSAYAPSHAIAWNWRGGPTSRIETLYEKALKSAGALQLDLRDRSKGVSFDARPAL